MNNKKIEPFDNKTQNLLFWIKEYLQSKIYSLSPDRNKAETYKKNRELFYNVILEAQTIDELKDATTLVINNGLTGLRTYTSPLYPFYDFFESNKKIHSLRDIDTNEINSYVSLKYQKLKPNSKRVYYIQLRSLFKFIDEKSFEEDNFKFNIGTLKDGTRAKSPIKTTSTKTFKFLEPKEFERFVESIKNYKSKRKDIFNQKLMIKIFCFGGLRAVEARFIKKTDCSIKKLGDEKYLQILINGKGGHQRHVYINYRYIKTEYEKTLELNKECEYLFYSRDNKQYGDKSVYNLIKRFYANANIETLDTHSLRRSWATYLHSKGVKLDDIITLLGHLEDDIHELYVYSDKKNISNVPKLFENL